MFSFYQGVQDKVGPVLTCPVKLVDESHFFCDGIAEYMTDNTDFTVIGWFVVYNIAYYIYPTF